MKKILIKTDRYAGNFERELTAWITGIVGDEDDTGIEMVEDNIRNLFVNYINLFVPDHNGTMRPCAIDDDCINTVVIFLEQELPDHLKQLVYERVNTFNEEYIKRNGFYSQYPENWNKVNILDISFNN